MNPSSVDAVLTRAGVAFAYLFGSRATGRHCTGSDADVGIKVERPLRLLEEVAQALASALDVPAVDLEPYQKLGPPPASLQVTHTVARVSDKAPRRPRPCTLAAQGTDRPGGAASVQRRRTRSGGLRGPDPERVLRLPSHPGHASTPFLATGRRGRPRWLISTGCTNGSRRSARTRGGVADAALQGTARPDGRRAGQGPAAQLTVASEIPWPYPGPPRRMRIGTGSAVLVRAWCA